MLRWTLLAATATTLACSPQKRIELKPDRAALGSIRSLYLGDFGKGEGSDLVREKIRVLLLNSGRFAIVDDEGKADAVLAGSAGVDIATVEGTTDYAGIGLLRVKDRRSGRTIWAHEYERGVMWGGGSVSSRVANQMVRQLLRDAGAEQ